ncbi:histidine kinase N-terminal 7TM domain-containing protein [Halodesulfurarchaeum sp.]|uniref:histidine kinase N-terminal 7TM domain-containing protein n=1 Tax=Halodesulfurarchaeum sp. TaxID=1980530 RepID=UPI002FC29498
MVVPTVIILVISVVLIIGLAAAAWRFRTRRGAKLFGVLQVLSAIWAVVTIIGLQLPPSPVQVRVWGLSTGVSLVVAVFWFAFILRYTGREYLLRLRRFTIIALPIAVGAGLYFVAPTWSPLVREVEQTTINAGTIVQAEIGPIGGILGAYLYLLFFIGLVIVVKTIIESNSLFAGQGIALVLGSLVTIIASILAIIGIPTPGYPTTEVLLTGQALFWGYAVFGQEFLQVVPAIATIGERAVFKNLDDGIVVIDREGRVVRSNAAADTYLEMDEIGGEAFDTMLDKMEVGTLADLPARFQHQEKTYRATISPVKNWQGETIGQTVTIQDVTTLVRRQERLQVLNRILRHNVRNDMNVVRGHSTLLQEDDPDNLTKIGKTIEEKTNNLLTISEKAIELNKIFNSSSTVERVDLNAMVDEIVSPLVDQYPDTTIRTDISAGEFTTDSRILSLVLEEVITNAVVHSGDAPEVTIDAKHRTENLELVITDDGPGIPQMEIDPIITGEETNLEHASSIGLWLIYWGTELLKGNVEFVTAGEGTTVRLVLPEMEISNTQS